jgi:hypothetical protein
LPPPPRRSTNLIIAVASNALVNLLEVCEAHVSHNASNILGMRIFGVRSEGNAIGDVLKEGACDVLRAVRFEKRDAGFEHAVSDVIEVSLDQPESVGLAVELVQRLRKAIEARIAVAWDFNGAINALAKRHPGAVLDGLVDRAHAERSLRGVFDERHGRGNPLGEISDEQLAGWAEDQSSTRYLDLAEVLSFDLREGEWTRTAELIVDRAPDAEKVLNIFYERLRFRGWSGSRAHAMQRQLPLFEKLLVPRRPEVVACASAKRIEFEACIDEIRDSEASDDRERDERFE